MTYWSGSSDGQEDGYGIGGSVIGGDVERAGTVQPEETAQKDLSNMYKYMIRGMGEEDRAKLFSVARQESMGTN